jgi:beta-glucosidase
MADSVGRKVIEDEVAGGQPSTVLNDELINVVGTMPMSTLANFGGMSLNHDALDRAVSAWQHQTNPDPDS